MSRPSAAWHDAQYNNRARIPDHPAILQHWSDASAVARARLEGRLDIAYGSDPGERLDVFPAARPGAPVLVYIHGGYWRTLDKRDQTFVAPPFVDAGATVVLTNYALSPRVTVEQIVLQQVAALVWVWRHAAEHGGDRARIVVAGHSAGGHLAATMLACEWQRVAADLPRRVVRSALAISGVFDLEPLRHAPFLAADLKLSAASARKVSPAFMAPPAGPLAAVVGGDESEEFRRQNALIRERWGYDAVPICEEVPGRHHLNVVLDLADPASRLHRIALELLGLG